MLKKLLAFTLTLSLNASLAQDTLPFRKRFYLELDLCGGMYNADFKSYKHSTSPSSYSHYQYGYFLYGYSNPFTYKSEKGSYIAGSVGGFYKYRWMKLGILYQGGRIRNQVFQHSINIGGGFNTLGWLKKSRVWLGPFASIGGIIPFDGRSYIGSYRLDLGADLYIYNFHIGYRYSTWDEARSSDLSKMKIHYLEIGYAIPLRKREKRRREVQGTWLPPDKSAVNKRFH